MGIFRHLIPDHKSPPAEGVVGVGQKLKRNACGQPGGLNRPDHRRLTLRPGIEHGGDKHVAREPAHGVEVNSGGVW
jgi:hypothetical protein